MSLLHSPGVQICSTLTKMFVDQFAKLSDEERLIVIEKFWLEVNAVSDTERSPKDIAASNPESHEKN